MATGQSEVACDGLQEFGGKSPQRLPPPKGLSRQPWPHGASPHMARARRGRPPPLLQKRLVGDSASPPETFSPIQTRNAQHESPTLVAHGSPTHQAPFRLDEKTEADSGARGLSSVGCMNPSTQVMRGAGGSEHS